MTRERYELYRAKTLLALEEYLLLRTVLEGRKDAPAIEAREASFTALRKAHRAQIAAEEKLNRYSRLAVRNLYAEAKELIV